VTDEFVGGRIGQSVKHRGCRMCYIGRLVDMTQGSPCVKYASVE